MSSERVGEHRPLIERIAGPQALETLSDFTMAGSLFAAFMSFNKETGQPLEITITAATIVALVSALINVHARNEQYKASH